MPDLTKGFSLTRKELALLQAQMPTFEKSLENQRKGVEALDKALADFRSTQLLGTKAFSDAAFASEQAVKALQLQRLDLVIGGAGEEDTVITDIDKQIDKLQQTAERASLVESLQLDPLKRKLEETFNPVKELSFESIVSQFKDLSTQQALQTTTLAEQERIHTLLADAIDRGAQKFDKIDAAAQRAHQKIVDAGTAAAGASGGYTALGTAATSAATGVGKLDKAATKFDSFGGDVASRVATGITDAAPTIRRAVDRVILATKLRFIVATAPESAVNVAARAFGRSTMVNAARGVNDGAVTVLYPAVRRVGANTGAIFGVMSLPTSVPNLASHTFGFGLMNSFEAGMKARMGDLGNKGKGTIAFYLNKTIPALIAQLKGPVAYDATILVPAGEAVMTGFEKGLRAGFGPVEGFLRDVGPSMEEFVPDSVFADRTKKFMVDVAMGKSPDPYEFFKDLVPPEIQGFSGALDPTLGFLHKTLSLADTEGMAGHLAKLFGLSVTSTDRAAGTLTSSGNVSDHTFGTAADISGPVASMDRLAAAIAPLFGNVFKQIIWNNRDVNRGFYVPDHLDHVHAAWLMGAGFSKHSGKIGDPPVFDIPQASTIVDKAISAAARATGVSVELLAAIARQESSFRPTVVSADGGYGLFQLTSESAKRGVFNLFDPFQNALGGAKYLKGLLDQFGGNELLAIAGYNAGPGRAHNPPASTRNTYIPNVLKFLAEYRKRFGGFRADGGPVNAGFSYMVNERGPESMFSNGRLSMIGNGSPQMIMPRSSGTVIDAEATKMLLNAARGSKNGVSHTSHFNIKTNARDPRAVADYIDAHTRRQMARVSL